MCWRRAFDHTRAARASSHENSVGNFARSTVPTEPGRRRPVSRRIERKTARSWHNCRYAASNSRTTSNPRTCSTGISSSTSASIGPGGSTSTSSGTGTGTRSPDSAGFPGCTTAMIEHPSRMTYVQQGLRVTTSPGRARHVGSSPHLVSHTIHRNSCSYKSLARSRRRARPQVESGVSRNVRSAVAERGRCGGSVPPATVRGI
jgi:hypothetical protein